MTDPLTQTRARELLAAAYENSASMHQYAEAVRDGVNFFEPAIAALAASSERIKVLEEALRELADRFETFSNGDIRALEAARTALGEL